MERYVSSMRFPEISPGVMENEPGMTTDVLTAQGVGLVHPHAVYRFYDEQHAYLAAAGVDGVKVDEQCILETLGAGHGGRAQLTRQYHQALDASVAKNFPENGIIACMSSCSRTGTCSTPSTRPASTMARPVRSAAALSTSVTPRQARL